ncbi:MULTISPECIES: type II toxin-antitoxin system RelE/ParE family toxin [unclassified Bradyrhizobium]|uniref:type II toxin-antitoxin system RelE/ParE family toxin n=1 Tax=unclassified Bradyrhizobium TaxID=2631580 RepID=UPI002867F258|nr:MULTISPECIES: type II toxin-antitoxin system RelE/ParE family toxin [unclassified Bradyrhizobium]
MQVVLSLRARTDLFDIHTYLAERSLAAADRLAERFSERFDELRQFPFLGPDRSELRTCFAGCRSMVILPFTSFRLIAQSLCGSWMDVEI